MYPIRVAARLTGLSTDTLRAWERRYKAVVPARNGRRRLYSEADVERLKLINRALQKTGLPIAQLAAMNNEQLSALSPQPQYQIDLQPLMQALSTFDVARIESELSRLLVLIPPREMVLQVVHPILQKVGQLYEIGQLSISQEHMISAIIRSVLGTLLRLQIKVSPTPLLLFATPPEELHEFGILSASILASAAGFPILYLGTNLPPQEIANAAQVARVRAVVLSILMQERTATLKTLRSLLPQQTQLWIGAPKHLVIPKLPATIHITDFNSFEQQLLDLKH
ncbi:MAG: MerR family transcriptional regulator [Acidobacteriota bacterium]|nr:MerR family transcriptional regulator [Blastocatellia bacterium]MDW8413571.1 MerR family transcriptional regulator [Acidobacteriota bacterium]